jgi:hypothetical protein
MRKVYKRRRRRKKLKKKINRTEDQLGVVDRAGMK